MPKLVKLRPSPISAKAACNRLLRVRSLRSVRVSLSLRSVVVATLVIKILDRVCDCRCTGRFYMALEFQCKSMIYIGILVKLSSRVNIY